VLKLWYNLQKVYGALQMLTDINTYDIQMLNELSLEKLSEQDINNALKQYIEQYTDCFTEPSQTKYFESHQQDIPSDLTANQ